MRKLLFLPVVLLLLGGTVLAEVKFPVPQGFINDYAQVLTPQQKQQLIDLSSSLQRQSRAQLAVAIVPTVAPLDPKTYAVKLFAQWGVGEKKKDNGVLVLLAVAECRIEIEVGYGLEGVLNDARCGRVLDLYALPNFKQGELGVGVIAVADALSKIISGSEPVAEVLPQDTGNQSDDPRIIFLALILTIGLPLLIIASLIIERPWMILTTMLALLSGFFLAGWLVSCGVGLLGLLIGWFTPKVHFKGSGSAGGSSSSGSSSSSFGSSSSSSSSDSSFGGGSSGGGGAGRSW